ncbi:ABC transporter ATP-binding protein [Halobacteriovorax sp. HLS]|uniref:ABC transporter ATP-binding protein n=1 Tax=Halobacteriovorax sp. HLS TaxID=2234000 RepID=UPI000FDCA141|nr:ABC transporter ATP-binding protein [Halobacteriovorax sp. HLS]
MSEEILLEIKNMHVHYGAIHAIHGIDLHVKRGEIVTILGSNGAGKTTSLHTISGLIKPSQGEILYKGQKIDSVAANKIVGMGIAHSPEGRMVFPDLTVKENLEMGAYLRSDKDGIEKDYQYMYDLFPKLKERSSQLAGTLSGGEQQMLAIARAYMSKPELLLLDEPSLGIAPILVQAIFEAIVDLNKHGMTILLVEQNAYASLKIAHRGYVLTTGEIFMEGPANELITNEEIRKAYLGH